MRSCMDEEGRDTLAEDIGSTRRKVERGSICSGEALCCWLPSPGVGEWFGGSVDMSLAGGSSDSSCWVARRETGRLPTAVLEV